MEERKRGPGRPATGAKYTARTMIYTTPEEARTIQRLKDRWGVSGAEAIRRAIHEAAQREGLE